MPPKNLPALQPYQAKKPAALEAAAKPYRRRQQRPLALVIVTVLFAACAGFVGWRLYYSPHAVIADAVRQFEMSNNFGFSGSYVSSASGVASNTTFTARTQDGSMSVDAYLRPQAEESRNEMPVSFYYGGEGQTYLRASSDGMYDQAIKAANPASALRLIRADAVYSRHIKGKWLRMSADEMAGQRSQLVMGNSLQSGTVSCFSAFGPDASRAADGQLSGLLDGQSFAYAGKENVRGSASYHYRRVLPREALPATENRDQGASFWQCLGIDPGAGRASLTVDLWVRESDRRFSKIALTAERVQQKNVLSATVDYDNNSLPERPKQAITLADVRRAAAADGAELEKAFQEKLATFPALAALVSRLQDEDLERQSQGL